MSPKKQQQLELANDPSENGRDLLEKESHKDSSLL